MKTMTLEQHDKLAHCQILQNDAKIVLSFKQYEIKNLVTTIRIAGSLKLDATISYSQPCQILNSADFIRAEKYDEIYITLEPSEIGSILKT